MDGLDLADAVGVAEEYPVCDAADDLPEAWLQPAGDGVGHGRQAAGRGAHRSIVPRRAAPARSAVAAMSRPHRGAMRKSRISGLVRLHTQ